MGEAWYRAGKLEHKQNSFGDFIASAERLIAEGLTTPRNWQSAAAAPAAC